MINFFFKSIFCLVELQWTITIKLMQMKKKHLLTMKSSAVENNKRIANCQNQQNDKRVMGSHY